MSKKQANEGLEFIDGIYISKTFDYEMMVYHTQYNYYALVDIKMKKEKEFKGRSFCKKITKNNKDYLQYIELVGAPEEFLKKEKNGLLRADSGGLRKNRG
jgi:hypothetical protein